MGVVGITEAITGSISQKCFTLWHFLTHFITLIGHEVL
jgi:hypothetical protein